MKFILSTLLIFSFSFSASAKKSKAHVHGAAKLSLAIDSNHQGEMILEGSGEVLVGFESKPKNMQQEKALQDAQEKLKDKISELVLLPPSSQCQIQQKSFAIEYQGHHSDFKSTYQIQCQSSLSGAVEFLFSQNFPRMKKLSVEIITDQIQKQFEATSKKTKLELTP